TASRPAASPMTDPRPPIPPRVRALVEQLAHGDRSTALALHALLTAANDKGAAEFNNVAVAFRDDYLSALRASGRDAQREAGRLSLDEVRAHLSRSVFPRLAAEGVVVLPAGGLHDAGSIRIADSLWADIV